MLKQKPSMRNLQEFLASVHGTPKGSPTMPLKAPVNSPMASLVKKPMSAAPVANQSTLIAKNHPERVIVTLTNRVIETDEDLEAAGISQVEGINLAFIYRDLMPGDETSPISVRMVKAFLENVVKPTNESGYNKLMTYYNVQADERTLRKTEKLRNACHTILSQYRTIENAYQYSYTFRNVANKMAPKLKAPDDMGVIERVKWLRIWAVILCEQMLFWGDLDSNGKLLSAENTKRFNELHVYPETMFFIWDDYLSRLPDGEILYEMIERMLAIFPESAREIVLKYGEINRNIPDVTKIEHIRNTVKKAIFPGPWLVQTSFFCTAGGIRSFPEKRLEQAITAWKNGFEKLPVYELPFFDVYAGCKHRTVKCYKYSTAIYQGKEVNAGVASKDELEMYVMLYKWLLDNPDFRFGTENKTIEEYGMAELLEEKVDLEAVAMSWVISQGFARDEADVNIDLLNKLLKPEENAKMFKKFAVGKITADEISEKYVFSSHNQAVACFSKSCTVSPVELNRMAAALKRINTFGVTTGTSFGDVAYLELFQYLVKNQPSLVKSYANTYKRLIPK